MLAAWDAFQLLASPYTSALILDVSLRKDKAFAGLKWLTGIIPDFFSHKEFQPYRVTKSYSRYGEERFKNIIYIKKNILLLYTVQTFQSLG